MSAPASGGQALVLASRITNDGTYAFGAANYILSGGLWVPVSSANPMPTSLSGSSASQAAGITPGSGDIARFPYLANGTTWDPQQNNTQGTLLASAARTAVATSANQTNFNSRGVVVYLNITVASGTGGLKLAIQSVDPVSGNTVQHNVTPTAILTAGIYAYELGPGADTAGTAGARLVQERTSAYLPRVWNVLVQPGDATSYTYSIGYALLV